jgi:hypothetical protein
MASRRILIGKQGVQGQINRTDSISAPTRALLPSGNTIRAPAGQSVRQMASDKSKWGEDHPKSTKGLHPTILNENPPPVEKQSEDVKQHNREMDERAERAAARVKVEDAHKDKESMEVLKEGEKKEKKS